ncbi:hypothetical protein AGLY_002274 [Aphis glycines]|uniref:Uncharacterized protein n=1 Tax=Aphis glycines TaxID=307491 RepID=A0A6G0U320_APHGL|nr:hypothetical protein AGLY_002274 [Aphis glycines]
MVTRLKRSYKSLDVPIYWHAVSVQYIHNSTAYYVYKYTYNSQYPHILYLFIRIKYINILYIVCIHIWLRGKKRYYLHNTCITHRALLFYKHKRSFCKFFKRVHTNIKYIYCTYTRRKKNQTRPHKLLVITIAAAVVVATQAPVHDRPLTVFKPVAGIGAGGAAGVADGDGDVTTATTIRRRRHNDPTNIDDDESSSPPPCCCK